MHMQIKYIHMQIKYMHMQIKYMHMQIKYMLVLNKYMHMQNKYKQNKYNTCSHKIKLMQINTKITLFCRFTERSKQHGFATTMPSPSTLATTGTLKRNLDLQLYQQIRTIKPKLFMLPWLISSNIVLIRKRRG